MQKSIFVINKIKIEKRIQQKMKINNNYIKQNKSICYYVPEKSRYNSFQKPQPTKLNVLTVTNPVTK